MSRASLRAGRGLVRTTRGVPLLIFLATVLLASAIVEASTTAVCKRSTGCAGKNFECIDHRCMCSPLWAHSGSECDVLTWTSWALVSVLVLASIFSIAVLASAAKKLSTRSSTLCQGLLELVSMLCQQPKEQDTGSTTVRVVLLSAIINICSYTWKMLTAAGVISDAMSAYWHARFFFPVSEGFLVLPAAMVVSVWVDVANSSMSRSKSKARLERTKKTLQLGTASYIVLLLLMSIFDKIDLAMVVQLGAIGLGLTACGSGAAKLCNTLRALGESSASIADTVFKVSRSMGISLYGVFIGNAMILSSRTRKSEPANLALLGILVSSFSKCFLHKAIFEYMVQSARAKKARLAASARLTRMPASTLRPAVHLVASLRSMRANKEKNRGVVPTERSDVKPITSGNAEHPGKPAMPSQIKPKSRAKEERIGNVNGDDHPAEEKENAEISVMEVVKFDEERTVT